MDTSRAFIVRVTTAPPRVVVEDVREARRVVVKDLAGVGSQISVWLGAPAAKARDGGRSAPREDSVSPPT